jgi:hypothetical protein
VVLEASGAPIMAVACHCADCRRAGEGFDTLPGASQVLDADGGTQAVLFRKDRVRVVRGAEFLEDHRLTPSSPTRRVLARCCNTPMFGDFTKGHWVSLYRARFADGGQEKFLAPQMRIMTRSRRAGVTLADDIPNYPGFPPRFLLKLVVVWAGMGFRNPKISGQS